MPTSDDPIYDFPLVKAALKRRGIDVEYTGGYKIVRPADVIFKDGHGNVEFQNDQGERGIFIKDNAGHYHQVFMYKRDYYLNYGLPKYHICQCNTIQEFMDSGGFKDHYRYANTDEVVVQDKSNHNREVTVSNLDLCGNCAGLLNDRYRRNMPLKEFVNILREAGEADPDEEEKEVDMLGYVRDWQKISQAKRELENYTCEQCGFKAESMFDRRFIHVHHIDGNKLNNRQENLKCLCIRCHANVDDHHRENFSHGDIHLQLEEFNSLHNKPLLKCLYYADTIDTLKDMGETSIRWAHRKTDGKIIAVFVKDGYIPFDDSMGDMDGKDRKQKLRDSMMVINAENGKAKIYPKNKFEFVKVPKKKDNQN